MDAVFGATNFRGEIIWKRSQTVKGNFGQGAKGWAPNTDSILFYTKSRDYTFHQPFAPYSDEYIRKHFRFDDARGRYRLISMIGPAGAAKGNPLYEFMGVTRYWRYSKKSMAKLVADDMIVQTKPGTVPQRKLYVGQGVPIQSLWEGIGSLQAADAERLGYPTQKPISLLERIIAARSNSDDVVLDPFCGCGTAVDAAQRLGRQWIGIDITHLAVNLIRHRMQDVYGDTVKFSVIGEPTDTASAKDLAASDPYQFQWWALGLVGARPVKQDQKKGADGGIDGRLYFHEQSGGDTKQVLLSVKAGHTSVAHVRDLRGVIERDGAAIGVLLTMQESTRPMRQEAADAGTYTDAWGQKYPRIQILTVGELLAGNKLEMPMCARNTTVTQAQDARPALADQLPFDVP